MTKQTLREELKRAMLERLRYQATEEDVTQVMQKEVKQRKDSIEQFTVGGSLVNKIVKEKLS